MKTVDNFQLLGDFLEFPDEDVFYTAQIIIRKKDHPDEPRQ